MALQKPKSAFAKLDSENPPDYRARYKPFLLDEQTTSTDWISELVLDTVADLARQDLLTTAQPLRVLVLYGSLRKRDPLFESQHRAYRFERRSYSKLMAFEASRILHRLGCDVRVFDPAQLPVKNDLDEVHHKVQELRELSRWSDGQVWCTPEQHGNLTGVFKNQIDWIPLSTGSVRPTQGRTLSVIQVNGGSQSFNAVNSLRILGRWMRMFCIPNQSSLPKGYTQFTAEGDDTSRLIPSGNRDRLVDCMEELVKYTIIMRPHFELFGDRFSERKELKAKLESRAMAVNRERGAEAKVENVAAASDESGVQSNGVSKTVVATDNVNGVNVAGI